jgi:hypothetical protein
MGGAQDGKGYQFWNRIYVAYALSGERPGFDAAGRRAGGSIKRGQLGTNACRSAGIVVDV